MEPMKSRSLFVFLCLFGALTTGCSSDEEHHHGFPVPDVGNSTVLDAAETSTSSDALDASVPPGPVLTPLVDMFAFAPTERAADPWGSSAPAADDICGDEDLIAESTSEGDWFDIHTEFCSYSTVSQPLLAPVEVGDDVRVQVYFSSIVAGEGPYKVAAAMGEPAEIIWETSVDVPAEDTLLVGDWVATRGIAVGEPVYFHVANHGENVWSLVGWYRVDPPQ